MTETCPTSDAQQYWESFYQDQDPVWSGRPNPLLVREVTALTPGTALDLGCGEGADAIWLARQGWRVTAVDVSATVLERAAAYAVEAGIVDGIRWAKHDLSQSFPDGFFDLVSVQFFHSPVASAGEREKTLRRAAEAVAPAGLLLIVGHAGWPSWLHSPPTNVHLPTTAEVLDSLGLDLGRWRVELQEVVEHELLGPEGRRGRRQDNVLRVRRTR
ncbi:MAG: class I SAM-dependent methyltransferase [Pseudonocardiaceae bacterium]